MQKDRIERLTEEIRLQEGREREKRRLSAALELVEDPAVAEGISDRIEELSRSRSVRDLQDSLDKAKESLKKEEFTLQEVKKRQGAPLLKHWNRMMTCSGMSNR